MSARVSNFNDKEIEILNGKDSNAAKNLVKSKLDAWNGTIEDFCYHCINAIQTHTLVTNEENEQKQEINTDEKNENDFFHNDNSLSMLIDFEKAKKKGNGMCPMGHIYFFTRNEMITNLTKVGSECSEWESMNFVCMECESKEMVSVCWDCYNATYVKKRVINKGKESNHCYGSLIYMVCKQCGLNNLRVLERELEMDRIKERVISNELQNKPVLSLDLLCALPRKMALERVIYDIMQLDKWQRRRYCVFLVDIDDLKALNSTLGNSGADLVIQRVGQILKGYITQINNGEWTRIDAYGVKRGFCFRQGGDEYAMILECERQSEYVSLYDLCMNFRRDINGIVKEDFMNRYKGKIKELEKGKDLETIKVLKERKVNKILNEMKGIDISDKMKESIKESVEKHNFGFSINKIGISIGLFIPKGHDESTETEWIVKAEMAQTQSKTCEGKNNIGIFYERMKGVIASNQTEECLKKGCYYGLTYEERGQSKYDNAIYKK